MSYKFALFLILVCTAFAFAIHVVSPEVADAKDGDTLDLGRIGPGQTISVMIDRTVTTGGIHGDGGLYDQAIATDLPRGWRSEPSKLYGNPLQVTIKADPDSPEGEYTSKIIVIDENNGEKLGNLTLNVKMRVTWDVMDFDVSPEQITVGPGQPARFNINIKNKGSAGDVFEVSSEGSRRWTFKKQVYVPAYSSKTLNYEIGSEEEEIYNSAIKIVSTSSNNIHDERNVTLIVRSDLVGDWMASNHGTLLFPVFETSIYSFAGLIANLFR